MKEIGDRGRGHWTQKHAECFNYSMYGSFDLILQNGSSVLIFVCSYIIIYFHFGISFQIIKIIIRYDLFNASIPSCTPAPAYSIPTDLSPLSYYRLPTGWLCKGGGEVRWEGASSKWAGCFVSPQPPPTEPHPSRQVSLFNLSPFVNTVCRHSFN